MVKDLFNRTELLLGKEVMERIRSKRVIIFGVGGVGSWCAECLVREGILHLTLVDSDVVCTTNCNRQLMATTKTIGEPKVEALRKRLLEINPEADILAFQKSFNEKTANDFNIEAYDYIIDAIDSLRDKISLIINTLATTQPHRGEALGHSPSEETEKGCVLFSSMGAALRIDPTKVRVSEFWKVKGDPLAAAMRSAMRRNKLFPARKFLCVHSEEAPLPNLGTALQDGSDTFTKVQTNGSLAHITGIFGMTLAGLVMQDIRQQAVSR
ncbi:MAG: tRNA threonylcarbamoyladenosine dehydratase [Bacteroidaceae bacterium]|nr:tRNA threonylcarbamoyladenosine dehydratase [Bacteroidaceae bacterium]